MTPEAFIARHPRLYHMAGMGSWESIQKHGLLSTSRLLDLFEVRGFDRLRLESMHRPESVEIRHPEHGAAVIRDQKPMNEKKLRSCLVDMDPREWYETLNRKVFFWPTEKRLRTLLNARAYRDHSHLVLEIDAASLLAHHLDHTRLSRINSGSTVYKPVARGRDTFLPLADYPDEWWRDRRLGEVAVEGGVPDIASMVVSVEEWQGADTLQTIWQR